MDESPVQRPVGVISTDSREFTIDGTLNHVLDPHLRNLPLGIA
jgi:hypothetical protein